MWLALVRLSFNLTACEVSSVRKGRSTSILENNLQADFDRNLVDFQSLKLREIVKDLKHDEYNFI